MYSMVFATYLVLLQIAYSDLPPALVAKPLGPFDSMLRPNVLVDIVFARNTLPVLSDLVPLCKLLRPLGVWLEIRLVDVRWDIAPHTRICILKPRPSLDVNQYHDPSRLGKVSYQIRVFIIDP